MSELFLQFNRLEKRFETQVERVSGNWNPVTASLFAVGQFVHDTGQDIWSGENLMPANGVASGDIFFKEDLCAKESPFWISPLTDDEAHFEFGINLNSSHIPWMLSMLEECEKTGKVISVSATTRDVTRSYGRSENKSSISNGRLFIRPHIRRIEFTQ